MINRVLIRIKVVQTLYSYLLTRSEFQIEPAPTATSKERIYAYHLYIDLLLLIAELGGFNVRTGSTADKHPLASLRDRNPLATSKLAAALAADNALRDIIARGENTVARFDPIVLRLHQAIVGSQVFLDFKRKRKPALDDEVTLWHTLLNTVIAKEPTLLDLIKLDADFTNSALKRAISWVEATVASYNDNRAGLINARNSLTASFDKAYELYHSLLLLPVAITHEEEVRLDDNKHKFLPTPDDLNPNMRFVDNQFVKAIAANPDLEAYTKTTPIAWVSDYFLIKDLLKQIRESDIYADYMAAPETDMAADCEFWRKVMKQIILPSDALAETIESLSVFWNDDLDIMGTFVLKTIKQFATAPDPYQVRLLPMFKDDEDRTFGPDLFMYAVDNRDTYREYIDRFINREQWESERLAFMDIVVLITAIAEMLHFPSIPLPVTINEYIEIAKCYSTAKSGQFVNGILFSISKYLREQGELNKE